MAAGGYVFWQTGMDNIASEQVGCHAVVGDGQLALAFSGYPVDHCTASCKHIPRWK